jgi:glycine/D-amino acid oxidase-like deaminating enzyme
LLLFIKTTATIPQPFMPAAVHEREHDLRNIKVAIIGSGIVGTTTGIEALRQGYENVTIYTQFNPFNPPHLPPSNFATPYAGAVEDPYKPEDLTKLEAQVRISHQFYEPYSHNPTSGVTRHSVFFGFPEKVDLKTLPYLGALPGYTHITSPEQVHPSKRPDAEILYNAMEREMYEEAVELKEVWRFNPGAINATLAREFLDKGGNIRVVDPITNVDDFIASEVPQDKGVVFICAGLNSRDLVPEPAEKELVYGVRGQLVRVETDRPLGHSLLGNEPSDLFYAFQRIDPHAEGHNIAVLGGTFEIGQESPGTTQDAVSRIVTTAREVLPVSITKEVGRYGAIRPVRKGGSRLDIGYSSKGTLLVYNYGHGGGGVTVAPADAQEAVSLSTEKFLS